MENRKPSQQELLKLKLAGIKNGKRVDQDTIIAGAGIITGWVLWKPQFDRMGWLKDGKFIREEENNTAILAANWLSRLDGVKKDEINALIVIICDLNADEVELYSDTKMQRLMGATVLEDSIDQFYDTLLSLWPILEDFHKKEFIELFLQREGVLYKTAMGWRLHIVKAPYDLLMERTPLPWPISIIQFSWSTHTIEANW